MFGLEDKEKQGPKQVFVFELEKELEDPKMHKEIKERVERRIQKLKELLRAGDDKQEVDYFGALLHAYNSLLKVMSRFKPKG
jgi:uncharacterized protein DUF5398